LCGSSAILSHQKPEDKCFVFWDMMEWYEKVPEDGKPAGVVLKDYKDRGLKPGQCHPCCSWEQLLD